MASATNGITKITIGGEQYPLRFGRAAVEEMSRRSGENLSVNATKMLTDLVFSGMLNHSLAKDEQLPSYPDVYELIEAFQDEEDSSEQYAHLWETFEKSRWGSEWMSKLDDVKKKVEAAIAEGEKVKK